MSKLFQVIFFSLLIINQSFSETPKSFWNLPKKLSAENTSISFVMKTTWHDATATVRRVDGDVWLENPKDFNSIKAKIELPVSQFDSDNNARDERMREVMAAEIVPNVIFELSKIEGLQHPHNMVDGRTYPIKISGNLKIRETSKNIEILSSIKKTNDKFNVSGEIVIDWSEYGVEDPSIIVAKLYKDLKISFKMEL